MFVEEEKFILILCNFLDFFMRKFCRYIDYKSILKCYRNYFFMINFMCDNLLCFYLIDLFFFFGLCGVIFLFYDCYN